MIQTRNVNVIHAALDFNFVVLGSSRSSIGGIISILKRGRLKRSIALHEV